MSITFSNTIKCSGNAAYSPNDKYFAVTRSLDLLIYETATLKQVNKFSFCDYIEKIQSFQARNRRSKTNKKTRMDL